MIFCIDEENSLTPIPGNEEFLVIVKGQLKGNNTERHLGDHVNLSS